MEIVEDLKKKVQHLEYEEIKNIKEDVSNIKIDLAKNNILTQQSIDTSNKVADTMDAVKMAMFEISESVRNSNRISSELTESVKDLNGKFNTMEEKIEIRFGDVDDKLAMQDDRGKFDILSCIKSKFVEIVIIFGLVVYVVLGKVGI